MSMGKLGESSASRGPRSTAEQKKGPIGAPGLLRWARTGGWTGWQRAGLRGSSWGVLWGWGAQVSAVGLAGVRLPASSVTQPETLGLGEGVGTGQTLAPCAISSGPKGSWQSQVDPAGNPDVQGLSRCTVAWLRVGTLWGKSSSFRAGNSDGQRSLGCPPHLTPTSAFTVPPHLSSITGPQILALCFIQKGAISALKWPSHGKTRPWRASETPDLIPPPLSALSLPREKRRGPWSRAK